MFFTLSKVFWFLADPANMLLAMLCLGAALMWTGWRNFGRRLIGLAALLALATAILPVGAFMLVKLENRFPIVTELPGRVDGVISIGGVANQFITMDRGQISLNGSVERLTEFAALGRRYPKARLVFSGGSGNLLRQEIKEADVLGPFLESLGLEPGRVIFENQSRNTFENAVKTKEAVNPGPGETWVLITSAFHMPRSVGVFRKAGWRVIPYPVDFGFERDEALKFSFSLGSGLGRLRAGLHEWLGLVFYWLSGKSEDFFPMP
ncbi:MAG: YdcF family protein [Rhodospirillales bacterium]